ncbi:MAG TPA: DUF1080 domain-containing protein [Gemmatirosa sp.]
MIAHETTSRIPRPRSTGPQPRSRTAHGARATAVALLLAAPAARASAQAEVAAWGNVAGLRVQGQLMPFETSVCALGPEGAIVARTAKERQRPTFARDGARHTVTTRLGPLAITEVVEDGPPGTATLDLRVTADSAAATAGAYLCVDVPRARYAGGRVTMVGAGATPAVAIPARATGDTATVRATARGVRITAPAQHLALTFDAPAAVLVRPVRRDSTVDVVRVAVAILAAGASVGQSGHAMITLTAGGTIDRRPVTLALDWAHPGPAFDGLGGNFRIQNPRLDPPIVAYNLANLRVAWGRVEMPWRAWQPDENADPATVPPDQLDPRVRQAMEMARMLGERHVPVVLSAWFPPQWAVLGELPHGEPPPGTPRGNALDPQKLPRIYASIAAYLRYLKAHYGVEPAFFSFNEADIGIDVRQTPDEHAAFIKGLGAYLAAQGIATKLLLGDTSDATPTWFIEPALRDSTTWPYVGAVSFHSWRGWSDALLDFWGNAARRVGVPLLVAEGSTDAGAWRYPAVFREPAFAREEITLYMRLLARSRPRSILQWQLTSDYAILAGGGLGGDTSALHPTQRFWNLKQLATSPPGAALLPIACGTPDVYCAAAGTPAGALAVHVVNDGAARAATLTGLPRGLTTLHRWTTDERRGMVEGAPVAVRGGIARLTLDALSYTSLTAGPGAHGSGAADGGASPAADATAVNRLTPAERAAGWRLLFDGKTLTGWRGLGYDRVPPGHWVVADGAIRKVASGRVPTQADGQPLAGGDLMTVATYGDFELAWQWKVTPGANSGVKYNVSEPLSASIPPVHAAKGFEYQIIDDDRHPDGKLVRHKTGDLYDLVASNDRKHVRPVGEWNDSRLVFRGNHGEHWLNGEKVVEFDLGTPQFDSALVASKFRGIPWFAERRTGHIVLQDHGDEVYFRGIKIRELDAPAR